LANNKEIHNLKLQKTKVNEMTTVNAKRGPRIVEKSKRLMKQTNFSENNGIQMLDQYASQ